MEHSEFGLSESEINERKSQIAKIDSNLKSLSKFYFVYVFLIFIYLVSFFVPPIPKPQGFYMTVHLLLLVPAVLVISMSIRLHDSLKATEFYTSTSGVLGSLIFSLILTPYVFALVIPIFGLLSRWRIARLLLRGYS